jgi:hypothetical protein
MTAAAPPWEGSADRDRQRPGYLVVAEVLPGDQQQGVTIAARDGGQGFGQLGTDRLRRDGSHDSFGIIGQVHGRPGSRLQPVPADLLSRSSPQGKQSRGAWLAVR